MNGELIVLARRVLQSALKKTALRCGGAVLEDPGLLMVAGTHPCPVLVNSVFRTGLIDPALVLERADAFFRVRRHLYELWTLSGADEDLEAAALGSGMRLAAALSGMIIRDCPPPPELDRDVELRSVRQLVDIRDFSTIVADGFRNEGPGMADLVRATLAGPVMLLAQDTEAVIVLKQGEPVAAAMTMVEDAVAWIGWVATREASRGHGFGSVAAAAATRAAFARGARLVSLEATKMGGGIYSRMGYREILKYRTYWPPEQPH